MVEAVLPFFVAAVFWIGFVLPASVHAANSGIESVDALAVRLSAAEPFSRAKAADNLGQLGDPAAVPYLVKALKDPSSLVRRQAAESLGTLRAAGAAADLAALIAKDGDVQVRQAAALALAAAADESSKPFLLACLGDKNAQVVYPCVSALGALKDVRTVKPLRKLLSSSDPYLKAAVVKALGDIGGEEAYAAALSESRKKLTPVEEEAVLEALPNFHKAGARGRMQSALASPSERIRAAACVSLSRSESKPSAGDCAALLLSQEARVRKNAAKALGLIGDASAIPVLEDARKKETNSEAAQLMDLALERLRRAPAGR